MISHEVFLCFRYPNALFFSIERVFKTVVQAMPEHLKPSSFSLPMRGISLRAMLRNYQFCRRLPANAVVHVTGDVHYAVLFMGKRPVILTIHDCQSLLPKQSFFRSYLKKLFWIKLPVKKAAAVTCVSEMTKQEILRIIPQAADKIAVIPDPVDAGFVWSPKKFNSEEPILLHFITSANKNTLRLLTAVSGIPCKLRLIGKLTPEIHRALLTHKIQYSNAYGLTDEEIIREYQQCDILCFPSVYEGFGMPIIEAQATGRVVLTSQRVPMANVAGKGALLIDPLVPEAIRNGLIRLIRDPELREQLIAQGRENVRCFRPEYIAKQYANIYQRFQ